jgi:hypothetical protein
LRTNGPLHPLKKQRRRLHRPLAETKQSRPLRKISLQNNDGPTKCLVAVTAASDRHPEHLVIHPPIISLCVR